jgi:TPR repeat protein
MIQTGTSDPDTMRRTMLVEFESAAALGMARAALNLGRLHFEGELVPRDYAKAYDRFTQAASEGLPEAHYRLGVMHEQGMEIPVTYVEAAYHYRLAALAGNLEATNRLIDFYLTGKGVVLDAAMAEHWIVRSVQMGSVSALIELADSVLKRGDEAGAFALFQTMSKLNDPVISGYGFERLSRCYDEGIGVNAEPGIAQAYFDFALSKGNPDALNRLAQSHLAKGKVAEGLREMTRAAASSGEASYSLGQMYFFGTNVAEDKGKSLIFMRDAARMRHAKAMYFLAGATFNLVPDAPEIEEAIRFAESAEKMGVSEAASLREKLERRRDQTPEETEQVARARSG